MSNPPNPPTGPDVSLDDDPLLPWLLAAKSGDRSAERELLLRLAPLTLEVARRALPPRSEDVPKLALQGLLHTLRALPTFRGEERTSSAVAQLTFDVARGFASELRLDPSELPSLARACERGVVSRKDSRVVEELVDQALIDDAAVLVSQIVVKPAQERRLQLWRLVLGVLGLVLAGALGYLVGVLRHPR